MLKDNFNLAYKNIRERMSRSILTLLGISIGIMAIISLMGLGEGMQAAVSGELSSLSDTIIVSAGGSSSNDFEMLMGGIGDNGEYLTERDIDDLNRIQGVKEVSTQLSGAGIISFNSQDIYATLTGTDIDSQNLAYNYEDLESGSLLGEGDQNKCVIGYGIAHEDFDVDISVGSRIIINGEKIIVKGIFSEQGMGGLTSTDSIVILTARDFEKITGESNIKLAVVRVINPNNVESIAEEIKQTINENHGDDDFASVMAMSSLLETIQNILGILSMVFIGIAAIALVVASIGIMNTMLTSVMERTREIGIMKAIGAESKDVMLIFIIEGMLVSIVGGVIGIFLGVFGSQGMAGILSGMGAEGAPAGSMTLTPVITLYSIVLAISVSLLVGVLSSLYPAWKAARMSPIEAVRYE
jgi:putative ABC transport system permease protein